MTLRYYISTDLDYVFVFMYKEDKTIVLVDSFKLEEANKSEKEYGVRRMYQKQYPLINTPISI